MQTKLYPWELKRKITRAMKQEKEALSLCLWDEADFCRSAARIYRDRLAIAEKQGYWEHEYEPIESKE